MSHRRVKDDDEITKKVVQYVDDPKNSSALAMIHEMSDRAKKAGRSPAIIYNRRMRVDNVEQNNNKINNKNNNNEIPFKRRTLQHSLTTNLQNKNTNKNTNTNTNNIRKENNKIEIIPDQEKKRGLRYSDRFTGSKYKKEYVWDKNINRLVEKRVPTTTTTTTTTTTSTKVEEKPSRPGRKYESQPLPKPQERKVERVVERKVETNKPKVVERKYESYNKGVERKVETQPRVQERKVERVERKIETQPRVQERKAEPQPKIQYKTSLNIDEIKEDQVKEEKAEIFEKLKEYRDKENKEGKTKKKVKSKVSKGNEKYTEYVYGDEGEDFDDEDFDQELPGKNTKFYKKVIKNEPGSKVIITKKVIEESSSSNKDNKFNYDNVDSDEDIKNELKKLNINPSECKRGSVQVKVITEEYDEKGNKIYSKEYTTNKLPKGMKGNNELMDDLGKYEDDFE